jgi:hypothetical protein
LLLQVLAVILSASEGSRGSRLTLDTSIPFNQNLNRRRFRAAEGSSGTRRAKRLIYRLCFVVVAALAFIFLHFLPKNRMSSPKTT